MTAIAHDRNPDDRVLVHAADDRRDLRRKYDTLRVGGIPDRRMAVVGRGLRWDESGTGRAARFGAPAGAAIGGLVALLLWALGLAAAGIVAIVLAGAATGAAAGALLAVALRRRTPDPADVPDVERFEVFVDGEEAAKARGVLDRYAR